MSKEKKTPGKGSPKSNSFERTIKNPAKPGTLDPALVDKAIRKIADIRNGKMANPRS